MPVVITLTTDFGLSDAYAAAMKGVILGVDPDARIVDISHTIEPQNVSQAAFLLSTVYDFFPERTIHVAVVDPGVGTERQALILRTPRADFVAPDNGILSYILQRHGARPISRRQVKPGPGLEAVSLENPRFWRTPVSSTFHGRDIFAPVAAHLSLGVPLSEFGSKVDSLVFVPPPEVTLEPGVIVGEILHIDGFGNLVSNIRESHLPGGRGAVSVEIDKHLICGISNTYGDSKGLLALIGSSGYLEISLKGGSARKHLKAAIGDKVTVRLNPEASFRLPV